MITDILEIQIPAVDSKSKKNVPWHILAPECGCASSHLSLRAVHIPRRVIDS